MAFILDQSRFIGRNLNTQFINTIKNIMELFDIGDDRTRVSLVTFNNQGRIEILLEDNNNVQYFNGYLMNSLVGPSGGRNLNSGLSTTRTGVSLFTAKMITN